MEQVDPHKQATWEQATEIVGSLEGSSYAENFQPTYLDQDYLREAVHEVLTTETVTQPEYVDNLSASLAAIASGEDRRPVIITGNCSERVLLDQNLHAPALNSLRGLQIVGDTALSHALHIRRERGQNTKPRSEETEIIHPVAEGASEPAESPTQIVMSYMGDSINDPDPNRREPDPGRLVAAAVQARDIEEELLVTIGRHVPAAHEALNLYYERGFLRVDPRTGERYLLSADLPWIGLRTNQPDSDHVDLLSQVQNPVGIKLGAETTDEHLKRLVERLNPSRKIGKLVLMPRFGLDFQDRLPDFMETVREHASGSLLLYDIHGSTKAKKITEAGVEKKVKLRYVGDIIEEIKVLSAAAQAGGLALHGVHLETTTDDSRLECIDAPGDLPLHEGGIDPQLNPRQTKAVLNSVAPYLS
ncbi:MAG TPA: 3-deoxy-7-phosphoheptulonate synthase [Candidatus Saccharimonadales bacterium]|nr:3-deoxy-7-phosphoheptulonate synthase [Candidatus Saccharimonadales bacterium]